ncbi:hypothetical protein K6U06_05530 [Acidiferrimicrobium sp. IK]|uniref:hypothetical protein n=1 Tax=Acidiferrimicrobium sp. IK TaxID=2871700 RepID=UPI0021CB99A2|nr:hypothetical protein [Acidiferrimicrobium sp. IK]MCU4183813.1 hypothetical protein [Acidiferrimicrobium sp. IK]
MTAQTTTFAAAAVVSPTPRVSRAADRSIDPGNDAVCARCRERIKFSARSQARQVIANVYQDGRWQRVEHYHALCYADVGRPYGEAV